MYNKELLIKNLKETLIKNEKADTDNIEILESKLKEKEKAVSNLVKKLSLVDDENVSNIILSEVTNINKEINDIKLQLSNETLKINEVTKATLDTEIYIKILENFNKK